MENKKVILVNISGLGVGKTNQNTPNTMKDLTDRMVCFVNNLNLLGLKRIQENDDELGDNVLGCYSRANIQNPANDAFWGQWEIAGVVLDNQQFLTFDDTLSDEIRSALMTTFKSDILCCKKMLGVHVLAEFGRLGRDANCPICYIGQDNTLNITCHENLYSHDQLNFIVEEFLKNNKFCIEKISTRIYAGTQNTFYNLGQAKIFVSKPKQKSLFQIARESGIKTVGFGKIAEYFDEGEFDEVFQTRTNDLSCKMLLKSMASVDNALLYINLMDNDQVFLQRGDLLGYRKCLEEVDLFVGRVRNQMNEGDVLVVTSDHGGDLVSRQNIKQDVPVLIYGTAFKYNHRFQNLNSTSEIASFVEDYFGIGKNQSFLKDIVSNE